jgi:3-hydroxybutyryl-CoA dehydrogenase
MGPLALADMIGLDTCLSILDLMFVELKDSRYLPAPLLREQVVAGRLGKKSGEGFYQYA